MACHATKYRGRIRTFKATRAREEQPRDLPATSILFLPVHLVKDLPATTFAFENLWLC